MAPTPGKRTKGTAKAVPAKKAAPAKKAEPAKRAVASARGQTARSAAKDAPASRAAAPQRAAVVEPTPALPVRKRTGRRPGVSGSRQAIIEAARAKFAERGYEGATIRAIAHEAGVDAALIHHFFETKQGVFAAAMQDAFHPADLLPAVLEPGIDGLGERLVRMFLDLWDVPPSRDTLLAIIRSAVSHPDAALMLRGFVTTELLGRVAHALDRPEPDLRAALVGSQLIGLALMRYIVGVEPLASLEKEQLIRLVGPAIQHYLADDLPEIAKPARRRTRQVS